MSGATDRTQALTLAEVRLVLLESLQWCANNAVYYLGLIGAATYDLGGDAYLIAGVTLVRNLASSVGNALAGPVIDRVGPRLTALGTLAGSVLCSLLMLVMPLTQAALVFAAFFLGTCGGFINTCTRSYPAYLTNQREHLKVLNGKVVFFSNIAFTVGPIVGGLLIGFFTTKMVYALMAALMAAAFVVTLGCVEQIVPERDEKDEHNGLLSGMVEGARLTFANRKLRIIFLSGFLGFFAFGAFDSLESLFYRDILQVDIVWLGLLSAVAGLTASVGAGLLTRIPAKYVTLRLLLFTLLGVGVASMVYVGTDVFAIAALGQGLSGLAWGVLEPVEGTLIQEEAPMTHLGRIMGFQRFGLMSAGVLPLMAAPFLADAFGVQSVLLGAAVVITCSGAFFFGRETVRERVRAAR